MELKWWPVVLVAACSGGKAKAVEDARRPLPPGDAAGEAAEVPLGPYRVDETAKTGDVQVRVQWKDVPQPLRASPGRTPCGTPHAPPLAPTTTWGIPEAFVAVDVDHGKPFEPPRTRLVLADCALQPRTAIAGDTLAIASGTEQPVTVAIAAGGGKPRTLYLPVVGHEVEVILTAGESHHVTSPGATAATVYSATTPYVAITGPTGQVVVRDVPIGKHRVRAWFPERGPLEARSVVGTVTVTEDALAEVTLDIGK